jgi:hypothetical protein
VCAPWRKQQGVSPATVRRIWDAHGLEPHHTHGFRLARDQRFDGKLTDVVGLYLNPPDKVAVLCRDEKRQIQALNRTQPALLLKKGRCGTMTDDHKRHGTTTLFAALNVLDRTVIGECKARHRRQEFLQFLRRLDREFPLNLDLHLILENYGHAQASQEERFSVPPSALPSPFHSDQLVAVESGRMLVW